MEINWNPRPSTQCNEQTIAGASADSGIRSDNRPHSTNSSLHPDLPDLDGQKSDPLGSLRRRHGFHTGVLYCALVTGTVFAVNLVLTSVVVGKYGTSEGLGTIHRGKCQPIKTLDTGLHLLINVLSTLLLSSSNYCMQYLSSPTRSDIDEAHRQGSWLHVGVPNFRNLLRISWLRKILWVVLVLSSVPLHLLYNSAVFATLSGQEVSVFTVTNDFVQGASYEVPERLYNPENTTITDLSFADLDPQDAGRKLSHLQKSISSLTRLENYDCIKTYSEPYSSGWGDVLLVSSSANSNNSLLGGLSLGELSTTGNFVEFNKSWVCCALVGMDTRCEGRCDVGKTLSTAKDWKLGQFPISYCLARPPLDNCELQISLNIMAAVIGVNLVKFLCMVWIAWRMDLRPLVTLGDAIASFLDAPDPTTKGRCLASKDRSVKKSLKVNSVQRVSNIPLPLQYRPKRRSWFLIASGGRWLTVIALSSFTLITVLTLFLSCVGVTGISPSTFGVPDPANVIMFPGAINNGYQFGIYVSVLVANSPQLLLSLIYFAYNSLFSSLLLACEWNDYAHERKPLRVSNPVGKQRSTYRLSLPYRYGIPFLIISGLLHWLISQSIFLIRIKAYTISPTGSSVEDPQNDITSCGFSPSAILGSLIVGSIVLLIAVGYGFRKMKPGMPLMESCSAAISVACHPPMGDDAASLEAVKWGACENGNGEWTTEVNLGGGEEGSNVVQVGHCSFTSFDRCETPVRKRYYAGG